MNLLKDPWIPVRNGADFQQITYKDLLCLEQPMCRVALSRDDLELACIQMLAALTQVIFMPADKKELRTRIQTPLTEQEYETRVKEYEDWFDLNHPKWPFMQVLEPGTDETTPIQKLFLGLPAGNSHAFFNESNECEKVCLPCAAIGLFNSCTHAPNISGKHKGGLRGNAPISTMIYDGSLRKMIWMNVLSQEMVDRIMLGNRQEIPVWVEKIKGAKKQEDGEQIQATNIGMARGLFWTPILVRLLFHNEPIVCDCCGLTSNVGIKGFRLGSVFMFIVKGLWPHPYSPRQLNLQKENKKGKEIPEESVVSFTTTEPAWTQFSELLFHSEKTDKKEGYVPATVISQYHDLFSDKTMYLLIGGYRNKQASILQRRHELYSIPAGWSDDLRDRIIEIIDIGLSMKEILVNKVLYPVVKGDEKKGLKGVGVAINTKASVLYFYLTESHIHNMLRETSLREFAQAKIVFLENISQICLDIFERVTQAYIHKPELIGTVALGRVKLRRLLKELKNKHSVKGGVV